VSSSAWSQAARVASQTIDRAVNQEGKTLKRILSTALVIVTSGIVLLMASPAEAAAKPIKNLTITLYTVDKGECNYGFLQAIFDAPRQDITIYDMDARAGGRHVSKSVDDAHYQVNMGACAPKAFVKAIEKGTKVRGSVAAFTATSAYAGSASARIKLVDRYSC
jgi:hypothetical protein